MPGKLYAGSSAVPKDPRLAQAYCNGRTLAYASGSLIYATGVTGVEGNNNGLTWTSLLIGSGVDVQLVDPGVEDSALSVSVSGTTVIVSLATDSGGDITSTAAEVDAEVDATPAAAALVVPSNTGASDGSGVVEAESVILTGSNCDFLANSEQAVIWKAGFDSYQEGVGSALAQDGCPERALDGVT